jgi:phage gp29-like protein
VTRATSASKILRVIVDEKTPRPTPKTKVSVPIRGMDTYNSHPAMGLTAEMIVAYFRRAEQGWPVQQFDMFDDIRETDGHLRGLINGRVESVSGCDWVLKPGRPDAASEACAIELEDRLRNDIGFREFMEHHLMAPHDGIANTNVVWDELERIVCPVEFINTPPRRFRAPTAERANEIWLIGGTSINDLIPLEAGLWARSAYRFRNPWAAGLMRTCVWWAAFKRWSVRDWQVFAEMFGLPLVLGLYEEGAGLPTRLALEQAVQQIGTDGYAILSKQTEIIVKETARSGDSSTVFPQIARLAEEQMSKLIAGATLNTDAGGPSAKGSYALGAVHEGRAYAIARADARRIEEMFVRDIGRPFQIWNGFDRAAPPRLKIQITRDNLERAQVLEIIGKAVDLDEDQIREEFSLRTPAKGKRVTCVTFKEPEPTIKLAKPARKGE